MLEVNGVTLRFASRVLFEDVSIKFNKGNCYGIIGANGAGKSTFLKILSKELEPSKGEVILSKGERMSILEQNHFAYENVKVIDVVLRGNKELYDIMIEKEKIYSKPDFDEKDGMIAAKLEEKFALLDGWNAESDAQKLLADIGIKEEDMYKEMKEISPKDKVKVLLAKALFGNPDVLLLDEPTNDLDLKTTIWLQDFLMDYENTIIVVSHDRYFLNAICTNICDIDYGKIKLYPGNYDFWYKSNKLMQQQMRDSLKKKEEKIKELKEFIAKFSANASKSKQATSRKKSLEKIELEEIIPSNRKYPFIEFEPERLPGREVLKVSHIWSESGELRDIAVDIKQQDKILLLCENENIATEFLEILAKEKEPSKGYIEYGQTIITSYLPKDNSKYFNNDYGEMNLVEWLRKFSKDPDETYIRSFLGRMLFSKEEALKLVKVLSGGEKVRCMLSKIMLSNANFIIMDEPTNHLDMESITALNEAMKKFKGNLIFTTHDHELAQTVANKIIEIKDHKIQVRECTYDEYLKENGDQKRD